MALPKRVAFMPDATLPELGRAASLATAIMRFAKVAEWSQLNHLVPWQVALYPDQMPLLRNHLEVIAFLRNKGTLSDGTETGSVGIVVCRGCEGWVLSTGTAPTKCMVTLGCDGDQVKIAAAPKTELPEVEWGRVEDPQPAAIGKPWIPPKPEPEPTLPFGDIESDEF